MSGYGLDRLCGAVYGSEPKVGHWIGGGDARVLHDATDSIVALRKKVSALQDALLSIWTMADRMGSETDSEPIRSLAASIALTIESVEE